MSSFFEILTNPAENDYDTPIETCGQQCWSIPGKISSNENSCGIVLSNFSAFSKDRKSSTCFPMSKSPSENTFLNLMSNKNNNRVKTSSVSVPTLNSAFTSLPCTPTAFSSHAKKQQSGQSYTGTSSSRRSAHAYRGSRSNVGCTSTTTSAGTPWASEASGVLAVVEGRGMARGEVGMAFLDLSRPALRLSQFSDTSAYSRTLAKAQELNPADLIFAATAFETHSAATVVGSNDAQSDNGGGVVEGASRLCQRLSEEFPDTCITTVPRRYFNDKLGLERLYTVCHECYHPILLEIRERYYCLAACAALLKYVEFSGKILLAAGSLSVKYSTALNSLHMSVATVARLELIRNAAKPGSDEGTLLRVLNHTRTAAGARLLRSNILQPSCDINTIQSRQECLQLILSNAELHASLDSLLMQSVSLDALLSLCIQRARQPTVQSAEAKLTQLLVLKQALTLVRPLQENLTRHASATPIFSVYSQLLADVAYPTLLRRLDHVLHPEAHFVRGGGLALRAQKCFAVKSNVDGFLDLARRCYVEQLEQVRLEAEALTEQYNLPFRLSYNARRGFFLQLPATAVSEEGLPANFVRITRERSHVMCSTESLMRANERLRQSLAEIYLAADRVLSVLIEVGLRPLLSHIYKLSEMLAFLDYMMALARFCVLSPTPCVRPELSDPTDATRPLAIKAARHPILERLPETRGVTTPNNLFLDSFTNFAVISGPNMSGKTTYLCQTGLLQILAQMGCFLPCDFAALRVMRHIALRSGCQDEIETRASALMVELREAAQLTREASPDSLLLLDELFRCTAPDEGAALAWAVAERFLANGALVLLATHYTILTQLPTIYPQAYNATMMLTQEKEHKLHRGAPPPAAEMRAQNLMVLGSAALPQRLIDDVTSLCNQLGEMASRRSIEQSSLNMSAAALFARRHWARRRLAASLNTLRDQGIADLDLLRQFLKHKRAIFIKDCLGPDRQIAT